MPSFLNKVFGYKKHDDREGARPTREASEHTLLDGKYETISPVLSPSASTFHDAQLNKDADRDGAFSFFKPKSLGVFQKSTQKHPEDVPHLTLHLPGPKEGADSRDLGIVFEADPDSQILLDDVVIAAKRLSPLEALSLVRLCAQAITERGLETLGVMHPHWFAASPDVQRKLISLFIRSLSPQSPPATLSTPTSPTSAFENELHYTRSPHDVAAVLRWGLRHLSLENGHFGKDSAEWAWYNAFFHAERNASYPLKGFSELLLPQLPTSHAELLTATLGVISSLAAHAELNGISGSKLSKFLGLWLLLATRTEQSDDWNQFYARWERAGRMLEHLFLARLREESLGLRLRLPTRLQELVKHYPYNTSSVTEDDLLPRPRFSTRQYDALLVRVEAILVPRAEQPKKHPIQLLLDAFQLPIENPSGDEHIAFWNTLKATASEEATSSDSDGLQFTRIFVDETIQLLSLLPVDNNVSTSPILAGSPIAKVLSRKRSSSLTKVLDRTVANNGSTPVSPTSPTSPIVTDWAQFSLSGFGDAPATQSLAALLDPNDDIEASQHQRSRKSSRQGGKSRTRGRRSRDRESPVTPNPEDAIVETKLASVHVVQIDEAFIDFWSDAVVDPIASNWPTFIVCGLKQIPNAEQPIHWLVIEQTYGRQELHPPRLPSPDGRRGRSPRPSFKSDISGFRINSMFTSARKRFSVFSKSVTDLDLRKSGAKSPITGELGEILVEEEPTFPPVPPTKADDRVDGKAAVGTTITSYATVNIADQLKVDEISTAPITGVPPSDRVPLSKEKSNLVQAVAKAPSVETTPQSGGGCNGSSGLPRSPVKPSGEAGASDPMALPSGMTPVTGRPIAGEAQTQTEQLRQSVIETEKRPGVVAQPFNGGKPLPADPASESVNAAQVGSQELAEVVATPAPEGIAMMVAPCVAPLAAVAAVDDEAPEVIAEEPRVAEQPSWITPADPVAASTVESIGHRGIDNLASLSTTDVLDKVVSTEAGAQLEPDAINCLVKEDAEVAEPQEVATPAPQVVTLVDETPSSEVSVDGDGHVGAAQVPAAELGALENAAPHFEAPHDMTSPLEALDNAAPQYVAAESQSAVNAAGSSTTCPIEGPSVEIDPATDTNAQVLAVQAEYTADHVPGLATEEAPGVDVAVREPEGVAPAEVQAQAAANSLVNEACIVEDREDVGLPTPVPETAVLVHETPGLEHASKSFESVDSEFEVVEEEACEPAARGNLGAGSISLVQEAHRAAEAEPSTEVIPITEPVSEEAQVHAEDAARSASQSMTASPTLIPSETTVVQDEATSQSVDEAAKPPRVSVSVPEDANAVEVEAQVGSEAVHAENTVGGPLEDAEDGKLAARGLDVSASVEETPAEAEASEGAKSQPGAPGELMDIVGIPAEQPVASDVDVSTRPS